MFGTSDYGEKTANPACTYFESEYARNLSKKLILLRMIPWEDQYEHTQGRVLFGMNHLALTWIQGAPMPITLVDAIVAAAKETDGSEGSRGPRTTSGATILTDVQSGAIDVEAVSWVAVQQLAAHPEMLAKLSEALKGEN